MKPNEDVIQAGMAGDERFSACWEHTVQPAYHVIRWTDVTSGLPQVVGYGATINEAIHDARAAFDALVSEAPKEDA